MNVVLISTYELGHQPFGLASPAAWLKQAGATVTGLDLAVQRLDRAAITQAGLIAFYAPMHTATRIAAPLIGRVKALNPHAHICVYGLYAPVNEGYLRRLGVDTILGGEFETRLTALYRRLSTHGMPAQREQPEPRIALDRQRFQAPDRSGLPGLSQYAFLELADGTRRTVGYTEASRGCKHVCRHCPIVPVYGGQFRIVQREVVLEDIRQQVEAGARHITFGDPDFFNGPGHAIPLVEALHRQFPVVTYDVTIKIEHLVQHARYLPVLRDTGCLFVTSAVESIDDAVLEIFDKRHTRQDFIRVVSLFREVGLTLNPTFVTFTPWTSPERYLELLERIAELDLVENVSPIQYAIRLLIPAGSKLLDLPIVQDLVEKFDEAALCHPWSHPDARVDRLYADALATVKDGQARHAPRSAIFRRVWQLARDAASHNRQSPISIAPGAPIPHLSEPWYC
ncbi:MAG TPA: CUAEP/CCAEP-tail radical SAM protein [Anaerolineae bacterium]|nr:CUAEP/CCAEP-tail radical SAM protein [Anaerolineae bacterium]